MAGTDANVINELENVALKQFRHQIPDILANLSDYEKHDVWLLKWLRARELSAEKAEKMLRKSLAWRKETLEGLMEWTPPERFHRQYTLKTTGFDKDGSLVAVLPLGQWNFHDIIVHGQKSDFLLYVAQFFEAAKRTLMKRSTKDRIYTQLFLIMDYQGFSYAQLASRETLDFIIHLIQVFEDNHPEGLKTSFIVNAPKIFEILFAMVKPLLTARTLAKTRIFGSNTAQWRAVLLETIEPDQLPSNYGGSITSCKDYKIEYGSDAYPVYEVFPESEMIPVTVEASMKHSVDFVLSKGSKLTWNFRTLHYDIGFSLQYSESSNLDEAVEAVEATSETPLELFSCLHCDSHLHLQKGAIVADKGGTYTLVFDNSFSRFRPKSLFYAARVDSQL